MTTTMSKKKSSIFTHVSELAGLNNNGSSSETASDSAASSAGAADSSFDQSPSPSPSKNHRSESERAPLVSDSPLSSPTMVIPSTMSPVANGVFPTFGDVSVHSPASFALLRHLICSNESSPFALAAAAAAAIMPPAMPFLPLLGQIHGLPFAALPATPMVGSKTKPTTMTIADTQCCSQHKHTAAKCSTHAQKLSASQPVTQTGASSTASMSTSTTTNRPAPRFQCPDCNRSYSTFSGLSKHRQFHCSSQLKRQFACKFCEKQYSSLGALKMHIRTHTLPCKCTVCGKAFSRPWLLQGHLRTHTGEKPFRCGHCGRAFADRSNLRAHLQTHSDIKKYRCKTCQKTFSRMSLLNKHELNGCAGANSSF